MQKKAKKQKVILIILDGLGLSNKKYGNSFYRAKTPFIQNAMSKYPWAKINASGEAVGLPKGQIGNSEVGHLNIGANEKVYTGLSLINNAINNNVFFDNHQFLKVINHVKNNHSNLHLIGLCSSGGVHSHINHLCKLIQLAKNQDVKKVTLHLISDGRDVGPKTFLSEIETIIKELRNCPTNYIIGSIMGRFFAMDRDKIFDRTNLAFQAIKGKSFQTFIDPVNYIKESYKKTSDEFIKPAINIQCDNFLSDNDGIITFNFRPDRMRQLCHCIVGSKIFKENYLFKKNLKLITMMKYPGIDNSMFAFKKQTVLQPLGLILSKNNFKQLRIAESQKYAHVTYFFDGGIERKLLNTDWVLIPSKKLDSFEKCPEMSAKEIVKKLLEIIGSYDFILVNFANPDMLGHTGNFLQTKKAIEIIDTELKKIHNIAEKKGFTLFITADHGNAEKMLDHDGNIVTKHTTNPVFLIVMDQNITIKNGDLFNISPTIIDYMQIPNYSNLKKLSLINKK